MPWRKIKQESEKVQPQEEDSVFNKVVREALLRWRYLSKELKEEAMYNQANLWDKGTPGMSEEQQVGQCGYRKEVRGVYKDCRSYRLT